MKTHHYVAGFAFAGSEVALLRKQRPEWQRGRLNGCGGHIEDGETPAAAMAREAREEIGAQADWTLFAVLTGADFEVWFFRCDVLCEDVVAQTDEAVEWYQANALPPDTLPNLHWLIPMALPRQRRDWPFLVSERAEVRP